MSIENLVKKVAAVVGGELSVPDQPVHLPDVNRPHWVAAVINAEPGLEVDRVLSKLIPNQEDQLLLFQQLFKGQTLEMRAEDRPVGVVEVNVVFTPHPLAFAHTVVQVFQLVLGVYVRRQHRLFQVMKEVSVHHRSVEVYIVGKDAAFPVKGEIAVVVVGVEADGQLLKGRKIPPEQVGIASQQGAVLLIPPAERIHVRQVEGLSHQLQQLRLKAASAVEGQEAGIGDPVIAFGEKKVAGGLQFLLRGQVNRL